MGDASNLTYVYCVAARRPLRGAEIKTSKKIPRGLPGASAPELLPLDDDLALVISHVSSAEYSSERIDAGLKDLEWVSARAIGHERIVEHYTELTTVIPMKLFTLFAS